MISDRWPLRSLGRCAKFLSGGTPSKGRQEFWEGDIPWVSSGEMTDARLYDTPLHVTADGVENGSRLVPANTVLVVVRGMSLAKEFRVSITKREMAFNQDLKAFACEPDVDPEFLFYALFARREFIRDLATEASHGTKKLETGTLAEVELHVPKPEIQRRAVEIASAYDELMENNRRRMELLEESARLLYREWFVRLRFPGHENTKIIRGSPQGWEWRTAYDAIEILSGGTPKTTNPDFWNGEVPFYTPKDAADGIWVTECERTITEAGLNNCNSQLFPKETIFISARGTVGKLNMPQRPMAMSQSCYALVGRDHVSQTFLFSAMREAVEALRQQAVGAVFDAIIMDTFRRIKLLVPEPKIIRLFDEFARPVLNQLENLTLQNQKLRAARDLLLPRLMSGEIAV